MKRTLIRSLSLLILIAGIGASLGACNTVEGVGEDISTAARKVKEAL